MAEYMRKRNKEIQSIQASDPANRRRRLGKGSSANLTLQQQQQQHSLQHSNYHKQLAEKQESYVTHDTYLWRKKLQQSPSLCKTYEALRSILQSERKRHILRISRPKFTTTHDDKVTKTLLSRAQIISKFLITYFITPINEMVTVWQLLC